MQLLRQVTDNGDRTVLRARLFGHQEYLLLAEVLHLVDENGLEECRL
mgnify:CR=1 FL=1